MQSSKVKVLGVIIDYFLNFDVYIAPTFCTSTHDHIINIGKNGILLSNDACSTIIHVKFLNRLLMLNYVQRS